MPAYPIRVPRSTYRGSNPTKRRKAAELDRIADKLEMHINRAMEESKEERQVFVYGFLAHELRISESQVLEILSGYGGGTGITVWKGSGGA